jgi:hypothetical protein
MRIGRRVFICTLLGGVALGAQGERPSFAAAMTHIGKGYELVQNDRFAEAAQEFRAALAIERNSFVYRSSMAISGHEAY